MFLLDFGTAVIQISAAVYFILYNFMKIA